MAFFELSTTFILRSVIAAVTSVMPKVATPAIDSGLRYLRTDVFAR